MFFFKVGNCLYVCITNSLESARRWSTTKRGCAFIQCLFADNLIFRDFKKQLEGNTSMNSFLEGG